MVSDSKRIETIRSMKKQRFFTTEDDMCKMLGFVKGEDKGERCSDLKALKSFIKRLSKNGCGISGISCIDLYDESVQNQLDLYAVRKTIARKRMTVFYKGRTDRGKLVKIEDQLRDPPTLQRRSNRCQRENLRPRNDRFSTAYPLRNCQYC